MGTQPRRPGRLSTAGRGAGSERVQAGEGPKYSHSWGNSFHLWILRDTVQSMIMNISPGKGRGGRERADFAMGGGLVMQRHDPGTARGKWREAEAAALALPGVSLLGTSSAKCGT